MTWLRVATLGQEASAPDSQPWLSWSFSETWSLPFRYTAHQLLCTAAGGWGWGSSHTWELYMYYMLGPLHVLSHDNPCYIIALSCPFARWENEGLEWLNKVSKITQLRIAIQRGLGPRGVCSCVLLLSGVKVPAACCWQYTGVQDDNVTKYMGGLGGPDTGEALGPWAVFFSPLFLIFHVPPIVVVQ